MTKADAGDRIGSPIVLAEKIHCGPFLGSPDKPMRCLVSWSNVVPPGNILLFGTSATEQQFRYSYQPVAPFLV